MLDGIQFKADGSIGRCGTAIKASEWIVPTEVRAVKLLPATFTGLPMQARFDYDMAMCMINVGCGHDPYNYVGDRIVAECIGIRIGKPTFGVE